jgi:hypothetical protein
MRFKRIHVLVIGIVVLVVLGVAFGMAFARPRLKEIADTKGAVDGQRATADTMLVELDKLASAQTDFEAKEKQTYHYMGRMPEISTNRYQAMIDLWKEYGAVGGLSMAHYIRSQPGIRLTGFSMPSAPTTPLTPIPIILVPINDFAVGADNLHDLISFLRSLSGAPRMATVTNVSISGTSPNLAVMTPLTMYLVTRWALPGPGQTVTVAPAAGTTPPGGPPAPHTMTNAQRDAAEQ